MITGVETAGLVLAVIPLTTSTLENYNETRSFFTRVKEKILLIGKLISTLEAQKALMENDIEVLLGAAGVDNATIESTRSENFQSLLNDEDWSAGIRQYLGRNYGPFQETLNACQQTLCVIIKGIKGLVPDIQDSPVSRHQVYSPYLIMYASTQLNSAAVNDCHGSCVL